MRGRNEICLVSGLKNGEARLLLILFTADMRSVAQSVERHFTLNHSMQVAGSNPAAPISSLEKYFRKRVILHIPNFS